MTEATLTYETACARIEAIVRRLDSGEAGLRETLELCQEGRRLVEFCAGELDAVAQGLEELRLDELVTRLEAIIARLDSGQAGLRETLELCQEGRSLIEFCAAELEAVGRGLEELRLDELVERLG